MASRLHMKAPAWSFAEALTLFFAGACAVFALNVSGCSAASQAQALSAFEQLGGQVCADGDSWAVCVRKCKAACAASSAPTPTSSSTSAQGGGAK